MGNTRRRFQDFWLPAFMTAFLILVIPANHTDFASFNHGATSLRQTFNSLTALSLYHSDPSALPPWLAAAARMGAGGLAIGALILAIRRPKPLAQPVPLPAASRAWRSAPDSPQPGLPHLLAGTMLLSFVGLELGHRLLGIAFPLGRSGLYFIPMLTLTGLCLVQRMDRRAVEWAMLLASGVYLLQFNVNRYGEWPEYANARSVIKIIRQDSGWRAVRVGASPGLDQVLNYYRARYALGRWPPVQTGPGAGSFDYYALNQGDTGLVQERHLRVIWRDGSLTVAR
jgi:hypothetical protein